MDNHRVFDRFSFSSPWLELWESEHKHGLHSIHYNRIHKFYTEDSKDSEVTMAMILDSGEEGGGTAYFLKMNRDQFKEFEALVEDLRIYEKETAELAELNMEEVRAETISAEMLVRPELSSSSMH